MSDTDTSVFGIYPTHESADTAVDRLRAKGLGNTDISVLFQQNTGSNEVVGGALGSLAGIGLLAIPGLGSFVAAGPIVATLVVMGAGGAVGGTTGALIGLGIPEYQARRYEGWMRTGGILLCVHADGWELAAAGRQVLEETGAQDIASTGETTGNFENTDRPTPRLHHVREMPVEVVEVVKH